MMIIGNGRGGSRDIEKLQGVRVVALVGMKLVVLKKKHFYTIMIFLLTMEIFSIN
jgi:hypothetical protein